ncbi:probable protein phosphatase 2C T23F11.1 isoform X2 [Hyalella azteca]|uniref:protein-serine/threonine phosphatase n=1 Tax=Hyalella azteca TaxID=294128 RepID=A0A8B7NP79_HYAAZ|nr:probable protein phosphatase 2C T23F11.1 isoform X2 [Hyalella azteca]
MGQTLSEPITHKETSVCEGGGFKVAASSMQGWRVTMEDAHTTLPVMPGDPKTAFFAVFDGHGGSVIAQHCSRNLHKSILARPEYARGNYHDALQQGYLDLDAAMLADPLLKEEVAGSTAVSCLITSDTLYCANVGDSRAVASVCGAAVALSTDHKPSLPAEKERIEAAGGWVEVNRVNGNLALSRAMGDFVFKKNPLKDPREQVVTAFPEVTVHAVTPDWEFVLLACDGIWDVLTSHVSLGRAHQPRESGTCSPAT